MRTTVVLLVLLGLGLVAPAAHAERWAAQDQRGDVTRTDVDLTPVPEGAPCPDPPTERARDDAQRDLRRLVVDHADATVTVTMVMRQVRARSATTSWDVRLRTDGRDFELALDRVRRGAPLTASLIEAPDYPEPEEIEGCGFFLGVSGVPCETLEASADARTDRVVVAVPRSCLGQPRWVSVAAAARAVERPASGRVAVLLDFWGPRGSTYEAFQPPYGPRVRR